MAVAQKDTPFRLAKRIHGIRRPLNEPFFNCCISCAVKSNTVINLIHTHGRHVVDGVSLLLFFFFVFTIILSNSVSWKTPYFGLALFYRFVGKIGSFGGEVKEGLQYAAV